MPRASTKGARSKKKGTEALDTMLSEAGDAHRQQQQEGRAPRKRRLFRDVLSPDLPSRRQVYKAEAIAGKAPHFKEGAHALTEASILGPRKEVEGVDLSGSTLALQDGKLVLDTHAGAFKVREHAFKQLAQQVKAPLPYLLGLPPETSLDAMNWTLKHRGHKDRTLRVENDEVRAIVSRRYTPMDDRKALTIVSQALRDAGLLKDAQVQEWRSGMTSTMRVALGEAKNTDKAFDKKGRVKAHAMTKGPEGFGLRGGITIQNSELGNGSLRVSGSIWRACCTNGMTLEAAASAFWRQPHRGEAWEHAKALAEALGAICEHVAQALGAVPGAAAELFDVVELNKRLAELKLTQRERVNVLRETLAESFGLYQEAGPADQEPSNKARAEADLVYEQLAKIESEREATEVFRVLGLEEAPQPSRWNLINGLTAVARDHRSGARRAELEVMGGSLLAEMLA